MKKTIIFITILIFALTYFSQVVASESLHGPQGLLPSVRPQATNTMMTAKTATGDGNIINLGYVATAHACTITWSGTTPTSTTVKLYLSLDGTNYDYSTPITVFYSPHIIYWYNAPGKYIKLNYTSKVAGDGTTAVTAVCTSFQQ